MVMIKMLCFVVRTMVGGKVGRFRSEWSQVVTILRTTLEHGWGVGVCVTYLPLK